MANQTIVGDEIEIRAPRQVVFAYLTQAEKLAQWWPKSCEAEAQVGGRLVLGWANGSKCKTKFDVFEPPAAVGYDFYGQRIDFKLEETPQGTRLKIAHSRIDWTNEDLSTVVHVAQSWSALFLELQVLIERGIHLRDA